MSDFYKHLDFKPRKAPLKDFPAAQRSKEGLEIENIVKSELGDLIIRTAITMAPNVPTVVAFEEAFEQRIGDAAFSDDMKHYAGHLIRTSVEDLGGELVKKGVPIKRHSRYTRGSIYRL